MGACLAEGTAVCRSRGRKEMGPLSLLDGGPELAGSEQGRETLSGVKREARAGHSGLAGHGRKSGGKINHK